MPLHEDEFERWLLEWCDGVELPRSLVGLWTEFFGDLRDFLDEHIETEDERLAYVVMMLSRFWAIDGLSSNEKQRLLKACEQGMGITIRRSH